MTDLRERPDPSGRYVRYSQSVEEIGADERETVEKIADAFRKQGEMTAGQEGGHALRVSHAKSTGLLTGELVVLGDMPVELAQGLFAKPGRYEVLVRLAQGPGEMLDDSISTHRGMAIKVLGVDGEHISEAAERGTQDFVLENGKAFINSDASRFLLNLRAGVSNAPMLPEGVKKAVSKISRATNAAVQALGGEVKTLDFFGHKPLHPLAEGYFSQVPIRYGDHVAKLGVFPSDAVHAALDGVTVDASDDPDAFRSAVVDWFSRSGAEFDIAVQLCTDLDTMPVEDASVEWPEEDSPYRVVARLVLPPQAAHSRARADFFDERLSFRPANSLAAHRPLGQIMRARLFVYERLAAFRMRANGVQRAAPISAAEVPD